MGEAQETVVTFYGQLQHIVGIYFEGPQPELRFKGSTTIMLGAIKTCEESKPDPKLLGLSFQFIRRRVRLLVLWTLGV